MVTNEDGYVAVRYYQPTNKFYSLFIIFNGVLCITVGFNYQFDIVETKD